MEKSQQRSTRAQKWLPPRSGLNFAGDGTAGYRNQWVQNSAVNRDPIETITAVKAESVKMRDPTTSGRVAQKKIQPKVAIIRLNAHHQTKTIHTRDTGRSRAKRSMFGDVNAKLLFGRRVRPGSGVPTPLRAGEQVFFTFYSNHMYILDISIIRTKLLFCSSWVAGRPP